MIELLAVIVLGVSSVVLLLSHHWRWQIGGLAFMYGGMFVLVLQVWPVDLAAVKLVAGWMACSILAMTQAGGVDEVRKDMEVGGAFRTAAIFLIWITVGSIVPGALKWVPGLQYFQAWGGLLLIGMGILQLGFYSFGLRVIFGLLVTLAGFEIIYAVVEVSTLVSVLMAIVILGISLAGAYLIKNIQQAEAL